MLHKIVPTTLLGLVAGFAISLTACNGGDGDGDGSAGMGCVAGMAVACACPDGSTGSQTCLPDSSGFGVCTCGGGGTEGSDTGGGSDTAANTGGMDQGADSTTAADICGNGAQDADECDETHPNYCPEDCVGMTDDAITDGVVNCDEEPTYALMIPNVPSIWEDAGVTGYQAGQNMCMAMGADHVCDYEEVLEAEMKGDFAAIPMGTTAWLHRTTAADIGGGIMSPPGVGGRCVDWTYNTNDVSDGEFVTFDGGGVVTYNFDDDTNFDQTAAPPNPHVQVGLLECGGVNRAILCCHPPCEPQG